MEPFTLIEVYPNGITQPKIDSETEILLIQDGEVTVGMLCYEGDDLSTLFIDSPINELTLNAEATALIRAKFPDYLKTPTSIVLAAPQDLAEKMEW